MASRYLLIEFDDADTADKVRQQIDAATRGGKLYRTVGLFAKPTGPYCTCGKETDTRARPSTLKRGAKFGWFVCTECRRPAATVSGLKNLLGPDDIIKPATFRHGLYDLMFYFISLSAPTRAAPKDS